jgi:3-hydroxy-D-aspartate aldolase
MHEKQRFDGLEVGFDVPALPGMDESDIQTPCLILDLDALERNIIKMGERAKRMGIRHRVHGKMHKSVDVALLQERLGNSCGVCCQKVSEAEVFARGGIRDILVTNQVRDLAKIDRLARLPKLGARTIVCVDDHANVADLATAARKHGTQVECLVELEGAVDRFGPGGGLRADGREMRQVRRRTRSDRGSGRRADNQRKAAPRAGPLRPDLQRA